jgi:hypothetical protein
MNIDENGCSTAAWADSLDLTNGREYSLMNMEEQHLGQA